MIAWHFTDVKQYRCLSHLLGYVFWLCLYSDALLSELFLLFFCLVVAADVSSVCFSMCQMQGDERSIRAVLWYLWSGVGGTFTNRSHVCAVAEYCISSFRF